MASKVGSFFIVLSCAVALGAAGAIQSKKSPMVVFSGFPGSPGHAASGNDVCIALAHCHGHQNGQQWRNILMPSSILSLTITIA
jgi:hypothetical protein